MDTNYTELILAGFVLIFGTAHFLFGFRNRPRMLLTDIYIWISAALIGLGPFISFSLGYRDFPEYSLDLFLTYLSFLLFFIGLSLSKLFFGRSLFGNPRITQNGKRSPIFFFVDHCLEVPTFNIVFIFFIVIGLKAYDFSVGGGFSGFHTVEVQLSKNYAISILSHLSRPFSYILYFYAFTALMKKHKSWKGLAVVILLFLLFEAFTAGRREMLFIVFFASFVSLAIYRKIKWGHLAIGAIFVVFVLTIASPLFLAIRSSGQNARNTIYGTDMGAIMDMAISATAETDQSERNQKMSENVAGRILMVNRAALTVFSVQQGIGDWMWGRASFQACSGVLPRFIRPYEAWFGTEQFIQAFYGMEMKDTAGSVPMLFIADFGIFGAFLGGLFFGVYLNGGIAIALRLWWKYPAVSMAIFGSLFFLAINTEQAPEFILTLPRNLLILMFVFWGLRAVGVRLRDQVLHDGTR